MRHGRCIHFIGIIFLYIDLNKNRNMQNDVKFHERSKYVVTFHKICSFGNNILKIQRNVYFFQGYTSTQLKKSSLLKEAIATHILLAFLLGLHPVFIDEVSLKSRGAPWEVPSLEFCFASRILSEF